MNAKKILLGTLAIVVLGSTAAMADEPLASPMPVERRVDRRGGRAMPEEIRGLYKEMQSLRKDMRLELSKDNPDEVKVLEMSRRAEDLHAQVQEWRVKQVLEHKKKVREGKEAAPEFRRGHGHYRYREFGRRPRPYVRYRYFDCPVAIVPMSRPAPYCVCPWR